MKITHYSILFLALTVGTNAFSNQPETPDNYAYGAELILKNSESMFSMINLDKNVYTQTMSSQLDDIRIFNRNGQTVPFALTNVFEEGQNKQLFDMDIYPINSTGTLVEDHTNKYNYVVNVNGEDVNIGIYRPRTEPDKYVTTYLLQISSDNIIEDPIKSLQLQFAKHDENWQATASLAYSYDLRSWKNTVNNVQIMTLTNDKEQTLALTNIDLLPSSHIREKNWVITLYSQNPIPVLTNVSALSQNSFVENSIYPIEFSLDSSDGNTAIYSLPSPQPVNTLSVDLNNTRSILPVTIFYKANANSKEWIKLDEKIFRKIDAYDKPNKFFLDNLLVQQIKFETINSSFETAPSLIAYRNRMSLVFNSANNAPFILAWGSATPKSAALNLSQLLTNNESVLSIPDAFIGQSVKLGGESALKADNHQPASFPRWIIWLGLIVGAGALVLLATKLAKEIKKQ